MKVTVSQKNLPDWSGEVLGIGLVEGDIENQLKTLDGLFDVGSLCKYIKAKDFSAKSGEIIKIEFFSYL